MGRVRLVVAPSSYWLSARSAPASGRFLRPSPSCISYRPRPNGYCVSLTIPKRRASFSTARRWHRCIDMVVCTFPLAQKICISFQPRYGNGVKLYALPRQTAPALSAHCHKQHTANAPGLFQARRFWPEHRVYRIGRCPPSVDR